MSDTEPVTVIIPTMGLRARGDLLQRALDSVLEQEGVRAVPLVVLNGQEVDPDVESRIHADQRLRVIKLEQPSLGDSLKAGRELVDSPWFAELDDDDVLLPGALASRLEAISEGEGVDVVVTNGYQRTAQGDILHMESMDAVAADPIRALTRRNWLLPGSWLCRTEAVEPQVFDRIPDYMECTFLAVQFSTLCRVRYIDRPTVAWYTDTPASASKSPAYVLAGPGGLSRILELDLPEDVRANYRRKMSEALHAVADWHRREHHAGQAWAYHLRSLRWPGGLRYLRYSARLLFGDRRS